MRIFLLVMPALALAGPVAAQDPKDPRAKAPPVEYRSAFEGYRAYAESELRDWRDSNATVRHAAGHKPGQGPGAQSSKPQPGKPETSGHEGHHK